MLCVYAGLARNIENKTVNEGAADSVQLKNAVSAPTTHTSIARDDEDIFDFRCAMAALTALFTKGSDIPSGEPVPFSALAPVMVSSPVKLTGMAAGAINKL